MYAVAEVLGWQQTLGLLLAPLQQLSSVFDWRVAEACLYCVRSALPPTSPCLRRYLPDSSVHSLVHEPQPAACTKRHMLQLLEYSTEYVEPVHLCRHGLYAAVMSLSSNRLLLPILPLTEYQILTCHQTPLMPTITIPASHSENSKPCFYFCRAIHKPKLPAAEPLLLQLLSSLPSMPTRQGSGSLPHTVAMLIGVYSDWLASTLRADGQGQALVAQLMQLLMQCELLMHPHALMIAVWATFL